MPGGLSEGVIGEIGAAQEGTRFPREVESDCPVADFGQFGELGRPPDHGRAGLGDASDDVVDLALGADVDATRRLFQDQNARGLVQPAGQQQLLLRAAAQRLGQRIDRTGLDREALQRLVRLPEFVGERDDAAARYPGSGHDIVEDRKGRQDALLGPVTRHVADAGPNRFGRAREARAAVRQARSPSGAKASPRRDR